MIEEDKIGITTDFALGIQQEYRGVRLTLKTRVGGVLQGQVELGAIDHQILAGL
ncbi:hypothetical protein D3C76_1695170 [compost metagenome]